MTRYFPKTAGSPRMPLISLCVGLCIAVITCPGAAATILEAETVWRPEVEQLYRADVYPLRKGAVRYLVRALLKEYPPEQFPAGYRVYTNDPEGELAAEFKAALSESGGGLSGESQEIAGTVRVELTHDHQQARLQLQARSDDGEPFSRVAQYVNKPWLDSVSNPHFVVVRGVADAKSAGQIIRQAAEQHVLPSIRQHLSIRRGWQRRIASQRLEKELNRSDMVIDRFQQIFYTNVDDQLYEAFAREAVLLDLSEHKLESLVRPVQRDLQRGKRIRSTAFSFVTIAMTVISIACWSGNSFCNRLSQGYYVWPIRIATALTFLASSGLAAGITYSILQSI